MTEDHQEQPLAPVGDDPAGASAVLTRKAAPRRKAARAKPVLAEAAADAVEAAPAAAVSRPRKPRRPAASEEASAAPAPAVQPELLPAAEPVGHSEEGRIQTQVISPAVFREIERKTSDAFAKPAFVKADIPAPAPAAPPPAPPVERSEAPLPPAYPPGTQQAQAPAARSEERPPEQRPMDRPPYQQQDRQHHDQRPRHGQPQRQQHFNNDRPRFDRQDRQDRPDQRRFDRPDQASDPRDSAAGGGDPLVTRPSEMQFAEGIVEVSGKGFGFLREAKRNFVQTPADVFVTPEVCRKYNLRDGQWIKGEVRRSSRGPQLFRLTALNGEDPEKFRDLPHFDELTTINPKKRIRLETVPERYTTRVMDLMTPIGKGQRGLIVAPPRTGKTTLLQHIGEAVVKNHPEMKLIILLVDERPEEVTEIRRTVPQAEMMASSNDADLKSHTRIAQLAMERAKRLVEANFDVFILLDSITRVGRAFNNAMTGGGGRTMSGGIDARAMEIPRKIFAAARNTEEAGSLTIMATALIETGSKMDEVIFQEFKGTGNMELVLDRKISDQRIYPAVDIFLSGTRREELLLQSWELDKINVIRRGLAGHKPLEAIERLLSFLKKFPTNAQMLTSLPG
jgi:transcription termination factor Rho